MAASSKCRINEGIGCVSGVALVKEDGSNVVVGHFVGEAVAAEQETITSNRWELDEVNFNTVGNTKCSRQHVALRVLCGVSCAQGPVANEVTGNGVVVGELNELAVAQEVAP